MALINIFVWQVRHCSPYRGRAGQELGLERAGPRQHRGAPAEPGAEGALRPRDAVDGGARVRRQDPPPAAVRGRDDLAGGAHEDRL